MASRLLWAVVFGFLIGVFARSFVPLGLAFAGFAALLGGTALALAFLDRGKLRQPLVVAVTLFACAGGILRMDVATLAGDSVLTDRLGTTITLSGVAADEPDVRESGVRLFLRADTLGTSTPVAAGILVLLPLHSDVAYGDRVVMKGRLRLSESFDTSLGRQFNYPAYLAKDGIGYELSFAQIESKGENTGNGLKAFAIRTKHTYVHGIDSVLEEPMAGLAAGITVGDKRGLGSELSDTFRTVGLVHVVVLSGYNIMIVIYGLSWILARMGTRRSVQFALSICIAVFFALITGFAAASVRAALMAVIATLGKATGRVYLASRALGVVAAGMVAWNPLILAFDPGFQLSILATAGLIAFSPIIAPRLRFLGEKMGLREIASATLGTQLAVLPFLLYQNGQLSLFSLPVNLLALIAVPWAMLFSLVAAIAGILLGPTGVVVAFPAYVLLSYIVEIAKFFASLPFASLVIPAFSAWWVFGAYAILFGGLWLLKIDRAGHKVPPVR